MRHIVSGVYRNFVRHDGLQLASAMAFDLFLAMVPLLALAGWATSRFLGGDLSALQNLSLWLDIAPGDVHRLINQHTERLSGQALAPIVLLGAIWLGSGAFASIMAAFERTSPSDPRPWWVRRAIAILCVPCFLAAMALGAWLALHLAGIALVDVVPQVVFMSLIEVDTAASIGLLVATTLITLLVAAFFRIALRRDVPRRRLWPGTLLAIGIGSAASYGFALYAATLAQYAVYYGSLAAVAVLLAWLWICSVALLLGAELNVFLEEQQVIDSRRPGSGPSSGPQSGPYSERSPGSRRWV
jgi:membrane protein